MRTQGGKTHSLDGTHGDHEVTYLLEDEVNPFLNPQDWTKR